MTDRVPLFCHFENLKIAKRVGFLPNQNPEAHALLDETRGQWHLPQHWTHDEQENAHFYLALGMFLFVRQEDCGEPIPPDLADWHQRYAAAWTDDCSAHLYLEIE